MTGSSTVLAEALTRLGAALGDVVRELVAGDVARGMTDGEILALTPLAESVGRSADVLRLAVAGEIGHRSRTERGDDRMSARCGCADAAELLTRLTGLSTATAKDRLRLAGAIATTTSLSGDVMPAKFPAVREGLCGGAIGVDSASAIIRTLGPIADRVGATELDAAERELVAAASGAGAAPPAGAAETLIQAKVWVLVLDPDGTLPSYERAMRRRAVTMGRELGGLVPIRGMLLPDVAEQLRLLFFAHLSPRVEDRTAGPRAVVFDDDGGGAVDDRDVVAHDPRSHAQKQHDVLASVFAVAARAADMPTLGGAAPTLLVTIPAGDLSAHDGVAFVDGTDTTVPALVARQIACSGGIQRLVIDDDGRVIELGSARRVFTHHQRRAITARDGGCVIPGCHVPAAWCEIHHDHEWSRGGPTHIDNGLLLCWFHHRSLETSGWRVRMIGGVPHTRAPYPLDPHVKWRPATGSMHRQRQRLRGRMSRA